MGVSCSSLSRGRSGLGDVRAGFGKSLEAMLTVFLFVHSSFRFAKKEGVIADLDVS